MSDNMLRPVDLIQLHVVLSSIVDSALRIQVCKELNRVLRVDGGMLIYDFRIKSPGNSNVCAITRDEILRLFPRFHFHFTSLTVAPPISRRLGRSCKLLYPALLRLPFLRTHNMGLGIKLGDAGIAS